MQHENRSKFYLFRRRQQSQMQDWMSNVQRQKEDFLGKFIALRKQVNRWASNLTIGEKIAGGTIFANFLVLCAWRVRSFQPVMETFFVSQISLTKIRLSPMILSCFSHAAPLHFAFNMYALYSFSNIATALLGPEQLVGLFLSAGAFSSLTSLAHRLVTKRPFPSLGASGAILGVIAYICMTRPDSELLLFFIPISAGNAIKSLIAIDLIGLIAKWKLIDHAAHLGGSAFGVWYALQGEQLFYRYRRNVVDKYLEYKPKRAD